MNRIDWSPILARAAEIVRSYDTSVTLRQLFYRLVAAQLLPNTQTVYKGLSSRTSAGQLDGTFPELIDRTRGIERASSWTSPLDALDALTDQYRRDRTAGQDVSAYLGVEKAGLVVQLDAWFGERGVPVLPLGGYSSAPLILEVRRDVARQDRPGVLLYAGDFDPSGEDIDRDFVERSGCWDKVVRVALSAEQVTTHGLPAAMGKATELPSRRIRRPPRRARPGGAGRAGTGDAAQPLRRRAGRLLGRVRVHRGAGPGGRRTAFAARRGRRHRGAAVVSADVTLDPADDVDLLAAVHSIVSTAVGSRRP